MKKLLSFLLFSIVLLSVESLFSQTMYRDVVQTKNGSILKGVIIEQIPNVSIKIETSDGNIFVYQMSDITKISKEKIDTQLSQKTLIKEDLGIQTTAMTRREPTLAWLGSFLIPGVGQFYNGQVNKGVGHLVWSIGSFGLMYFGAYITTYSYSVGTGAAIAFVGSMSSLACWIVSQVDAAKTASKINRQLGVANFNIGEKSFLSFNPDIRLINTPSCTTTPAYGLNMKLSF